MLQTPVKVQSNPAWAKGHTSLCWAYVLQKCNRSGLGQRTVGCLHAKTGMVTQSGPQPISPAQVAVFRPLGFVPAKSELKIWVVPQGCPGHCLGKGLKSPYSIVAPLAQNSTGHLPACSVQVSIALFLPSWRTLWIHCEHKVLAWWPGLVINYL